MPRRFRLNDVLWYGSLAALAAIGVVVLVVVGAQVRSMLAIHRNLQAMIVTATPSDDRQPVVAAAERATDVMAVMTAAPTMVPATPTRTATPTATPTPTATATPTPLPPTPTLLPPPAGDAVNVLLLGTDRRPGESDPSRTDSIIVVRVDPAKHRVAMLSLPRDLMANIPGYGYARVNAAYAYGSADLARQTVSQLLGIPIDYYIAVDFEGFIKAIDALGGVDVNVEKELYDPQFPTMDYGYTVAHFMPGTQHMDGATALMYSRVRHPDSDFARLHRQQAVLTGVLAQLHSAGALDKLDQLKAVTMAMRDYVRTDMPEDRIVGLGWALRAVTPDQLEHYAVSPDMVTFGSGGDQYIEVPVPGTLEGLASQLMGK
jgi:LCP family protein required for cell wall assembly